jgi:hypothetical protein
MMLDLAPCCRGNFVATLQRKDIFCETATAFEVEAKAGCNDPVCDSIWNYQSKDG